MGGKTPEIFRLASLAVVFVPPHCYSYGGAPGQMFMVGTRPRVFVSV